MPRLDVRERLYAFLADEEDARVCRDISEEACSNVPANFFRLLVSHTLTKVGDSIANPKTVLAWIVTVIGAPAYLVALLVPIRESGSMLPQLVIASYVRRRARRKWTWVLGSVLQALAVLGLGAVALTLEGVGAGWFVIALLVVFSLARGLCSVASKDVIGKTIPKTRRGRLNGLAASISGLVALAGGALLLGQGDGETSRLFYPLLLAGGALLWLLAAAVYARIEELEGETGGGGNALTEAVRRLDLLRTDPPFRRFVTARALLLCSALSAPYFVLLAQEGRSADLSLLGMFVLAGALAESLSASAWGFLADRSSRRVLALAGSIAAGLGVAAFLTESFVPALRDQSWTYPALFFVLGIAHSGVRLGRKTYVLDLASGHRRSDYVAVSNSVIGAVLLLTGAVGALSAILPPEGIILALSVLGFAGAVLTLWLPETD